MNLPKQRKGLTQVSDSTCPAITVKPPARYEILFDGNLTSWKHAVDKSGSCMTFGELPFRETQTRCYVLQHCHVLPHLSSWSFTSPRPWVAWIVENFITFPGCLFMCFQYVRFSLQVHHQESEASLLQPHWGQHSFCFEACYEMTPPVNSVLWVRQVKTCLIFKCSQIRMACLKNTFPCTT